jgi:hypothetical protein
MTKRCFHFLAFCFCLFSDVLNFHILLLSLKKGYFIKRNKMVRKMSVDLPKSEKVHTSLRLGEAMQILELGNKGKTSGRMVYLMTLCCKLTGP